MLKAIARDPQRYREYGRKTTATYRLKNRELCLARTRKWNAINQERKAELYAAWYEENYHRVLDNNAKRRAIERCAFVEYVDRLIVFERDHGICGICHRKIAWSSFQVDHIVPLSKGGKHLYANVQATHARCNLRKYTKITLP